MNYILSLTHHERMLITSGVNDKGEAQLVTRKSRYLVK